jgi:hypothetical protein
MARNVNRQRAARPRPHRASFRGEAGARSRSPTWRPGRRRWSSEELLGRAGVGRMPAARSPRSILLEIKQRSPAKRSRPETARPSPPFGSRSLSRLPRHRPWGTRPHPAVHAVRLRRRRARSPARRLRLRRLRPCPSHAVIVAQPFRTHIFYDGRGPAIGRRLARTSGSFPKQPVQRTPQPTSARPADAPRVIARYLSGWGT